MKRRLAFVPVMVMTLAAGGCATISPGPVLDPQTQLLRFDWWDNRDFDWYADNIPFLETPDPEIDATYYYRWELLTKHLVYGSPRDGYTFTEFIDRPFWSGAYGAISCPLGHQMYEVRWLKNRRIIDDFARYWIEVPGAEPRSYSNWYGDAVWATYRVLGDREWIANMLPLMRRQYRGWMAERWDPEHHMFRWDGMHDGMETNITSRQTPNWFDGAEGYRPTLNSYLFGDATAISKAATLAGDTAVAAEYGRRAAEIKARVQDELWDPRRRFFFPQFARDEVTVADPWPGAGRRNATSAAADAAQVAPDGSTSPIRAGSLTYETGPWAGSPYGREQIGFVPWQFHLPDPGYEVAWSSLLDPQRFYAPFGPTVTEQDDPLFYVSPSCCVWSGNSWPYATTQTLVALSNLLHEYQQQVVTPADWFDLFGIYTRTQRKQGRPYVAEAANPQTGSWAGHDRYYHSEHYLHSGYIDLAITGLVGLRPQDDDRVVVEPLAPPEWDWFALDGVSYRGRRLSVIWDRDGSHYGRGSGLQVIVDGQRLARAATLGRIESRLPPALAPVPLERPANWAVNNGPAWFPAVEASSYRPQAPPVWAVDGQYWYHATPPNRWVPDGKHREDWLAVDFGVPRPLDRVVLYFLDDTVPGDDPVAEQTPARVQAAVDAGGAPRVAPPDTYRLQLLQADEWVDLVGEYRVPARPAGRRANTITFPRVDARGVRVLLRHPAGTVSGLSEIEAWGPDTAPAEPLATPADLALAGIQGDARSAATVSASFERDGQAASLLIDGRWAFNEYTDRVWTAVGSPNPSDWIVIDLHAPRSIAGVELYLWAVAGRGTAAPRAYDIELWDGNAWVAPESVVRAPPVPMAMAVNSERFTPTIASRVRVTLEHAAGARSGVSEIVVR